MILSGWELCRILPVWLAIGVCPAQIPASNDEHVPTFGVTAVAPFGFCGRIYALPEQESMPQVSSPQPQPDARYSASAGPVLGGTDSGYTNRSCTTRLPRFEQLQPIGTIYTTKLNVPPRDFREGFPGVTGRFEWFALDYTARFWIKAPGKYSFRLLSDDGSALYIDERQIIDNDCMHLPMSASGSVRLDGGIHDLRVSYFQGPRWHVALVLEVKPPLDNWRVFDTEEFRPPANPADWNYANTANLDAPYDPCKAERRPRELISRPKR